MPRALLVPGDAAVAGRLRDAGWLVRAVGGDAAAGVEHVDGDPQLLGPVLPALAAVTIVAWLHGDGDDPELHGVRLRTLCEKLVDSPVRGLVYEAARRVDPEDGRAIVADAAQRWSIPVAVVARRDEVADAVVALAEGKYSNPDPES